MRIALALTAALLLTAGAAPPQGADAVVTARLGKTVDMGMIKVTPQQWLETGGTPRLRVIVDSPQGSHSRELFPGKPEREAGGQLVLEEATPAKGNPADVAAYRFTLRYSPL